MSRIKLGIKVLGLCALVFAFMGIASSGAQAAATWLVLGEGGTVTEGTGGELTLETETTGILHSKISGVSVLFECPKVETVGAKLLENGTIGKETVEVEKVKVPRGAKVRYSKCKTSLNGVVSEPCEPSNEGKEPGVIVTKPGHAKFVLHIFFDEPKPGEKIELKEELTEVLPDEGETFATIEMGKECSIGTKVPVIGKLFLKDCEKLFLVHTEKHLVEEGPLTELWTISKTTEHKATLLGSAWAKVKTGGVFRSYAAHAG